MLFAKNKDLLVHLLNMQVHAFASLQILRRVSEQYL